MTPIEPMDDAQFDAALVRAVMTQAETRRWQDVSIVEGARLAGLDLARARARFAGRMSVLHLLGRGFDQAALAEDGAADAFGAPSTARERLFDILMRRFDALQAYRAGLGGLLRSLKQDPALALALLAETRLSMEWMAQAAGIDTAGFTGRLRVSGLVGVWLAALRAWEGDQSLDLSATMAALDRALDRAISVGRTLGLTGREETGDEPVGSETAAAPGTVPDPLGESFTPTA